MSKYLYGDNRNIVEGSVVECTESYTNQFTKSKLYIARKAPYGVTADDNGNSNGFGSWNRFRLVQTAPGTEITPGDDYVVVNNPKNLQIYTMSYESITGNGVHGKGLAEYHERKNILKLLKPQAPARYTEFIECKIRVTPGTVEAIAAKLDEYGLCNKPKCKITISDDVGSYFINNTYIGFNRNDKVGEKFFEEHRYKEVYWVDGDLSFEKPSIQFTYPMWFKWHNSPKVVKFTSIDCYEVIIPAEDTYAMGVGEIDSNALHHTEDQWVQVSEPIADYEYPLCVRHNTTGNIYKYVRLQTCIWECYNSRYEGTTPHTNNCFTQIPEPTPRHVPYEALRDIPKQTPIDCVSDANTPNIKDNTMETQITVAMTAKEYAKYQKENNTPIRVKTDLELAKKHLTQWFNANGTFQQTTCQSSKSAEIELQRPDRIGWTYRTYTLSASGTTDIPTKSLI